MSIKNKEAKVIAVISLSIIAFGAFLIEYYGFISVGVLFMLWGNNCK